MADYNVNMKQWNGTSFDNVLPLAYNALALNGKTYSNVYDEITQYVAGNYVKAEVIKHVGSGTDATTSGTTFTFSFPPKVVIVVGEPYSTIAHSSQSAAVDTVCMIYMEGMSYFGSAYYIYTEFTVNGNSLTMTGKGRGMTASGTDAASWECNQNGTTYYLCAFH